MSTVAQFTTMCPTCTAAGASVPLSTNFPPRCAQGHVFPDSAELQALKPRTVAQQVAKASAANAATLAIEMKPQLKTDLEARFGVKLNNSATHILAALLDPRAFLVSSVDLEQLEQHTGQKITNLRELSGILFNLGRAVTELQEKTKQQEQRLALMQRTRGRAAEEYGVLLEEAERRTLGERAAAKGLTPESYLKQFVRWGLENNKL